MIMIIRKKKYYYILSILLIVITCALSPFIFVDDEFISFIRSVITLPEEMLEGHSVYDAFYAGTIGALDIFLPVVCALPSASYTYDELKSGVLLYVQLRKGRYRYIYSRYIYSACSAVAVTVIGLALYFVLCIIFFPIKRNFGAGVTVVGIEEYNLLETLLQVAVITGKEVIYGVAMSVCATFIIYLYRNLYFSLSIVFIISYAMRDILYGCKLECMLVMAVAMALAYGIMWRYRSERV